MRADVPPVAVTTKEAGELLSLSEDTIRALIVAGHLPTVPHLARAVRIPYRALIEFAEGVPADAPTT